MDPGFEIFHIFYAKKRLFFDFGTACFQAGGPIFLKTFWQFLGIFKISSVLVFYFYRPALGAAHIFGPNDGSGSAVCKPPTGVGGVTLVEEAKICGRLEGGV